MEQLKPTYIAIDLKSFYASVECVERGLDPMTTNLVVADMSRTQKTICLAVSPSLKAYGISGRARLFEVVKRIKEVNARRLQLAPEHRFSGSSCDDTVLKESPELAVDYLTATPRMACYLEYSHRIYNIYQKYAAPEDMHVYSIDEIFIDAAPYLNTYGLTARELAVRIIQDVLKTTGITATAGIGTNLYLCKVAMDIVAKHIPPDQNGVRIAQLTETNYRRLLWTHEPITDFWRVGHGYAKKLAEHGMYTMGDIARCSIGESGEFYNEDLLHRLFGVNAELLIDHAWGWEPCTMKDIKAYKPENSSIASGQVLHCPYPQEKARMIVWEMAELLALDLVDQHLVTDQMTLTIGYDMENLTNPEIRNMYRGEVTEDRYGRKIPKHAHGTVKLDRQTASSRIITKAVMELYDRITNPALMVRRVNITAEHVVDEASVRKELSYEQLDLFTDYEEICRERAARDADLERERTLQHTILDIKKRFGKNAILKGTNLMKGATAMERNQQIGGHRA